MFEIETKSYKSAAKKLNDITYTDYYNRLMLLARSVFEWKGLPPELDEKWIERFLFYDGGCIFFKNKTLGNYMVSKATVSGGVNEYDEPISLMPVFHNACSNEFITKPLKNNEECVLIRNNDIYLPTHYTINLFALRLTDIQRTIDVNISAQKTPVIVQCSERQKRSLKATIDQKNDNELTIFGDKDLDTSGINTLKTDAPIVFDKLQHQKHEILNECFTFLGINNANMEKRERLVDDEVHANNQQIALSAEVMLKSRQLACKKINELFGLNISVELRKPDTAIFEGLEGDINE